MLCAGAREWAGGGAGAGGAAAAPEPAGGGARAAAVRGQPGGGAPRRAPLPRHHHPTGWLTEAGWPMAHVLDTRPCSSRGSISHSGIRYVYRIGLDERVDWLLKWLCSSGILQCCNCAGVSCQRRFSMKPGRLLKWCWCYANRMRIGQSRRCPRAWCSSAVVLRVLRPTQWCLPALENATVQMPRQQTLLHTHLRDAMQI